MNLDDLASLARSVQLPTEAAQVALTRSYFASYEVCVDRLAERDRFVSSEGMLAACMSYSWRPRAVHLGSTTVPGAVRAMNEAPAGVLTPRP